MSMGVASHARRCPAALEAGATMSARAAIHLFLAAVTLSLATPGRAQDGNWDDERDEGRQGGYDVQVDTESSPVTLDTFQDGLSPYGEWVRTPGYGTAWRPRVAVGWRPYYYGRWEWTNEGWLWVSEEPFGWATYHYGRWAYDGGYGWIRVPGYQWAPAWVSWRYGGDVVGWAPLAPGLSLYVTSYAFVDFWWTFVPSVRFCGSPVWGVAYAPTRAYQFYRATSPAPPRSRPPGLSGGGAARPRPPGGLAPAWGGPPPRDIEARSGRPITPNRIVAEPRPGMGRGRSGEIGVYRPELAPRGGAVGRPGPSDRSLPFQPQRVAPPGTPPGSARPEGRPVQPSYRNPTPYRGAEPRGRVEPSAPSPYRGGSPPPAVPRGSAAPPAAAPRGFSAPPAAPPAAPRGLSAPPAAPRGGFAPSGGGASRPSAPPPSGGQHRQERSWRSR